MLETALSHLQAVDPVWIYLTVVFFAFIENLFPPSPSDVVVIAGASLLAASFRGSIPVILVTSLASSLGFMAMYLIGRFLGRKLLRRGRLKFVPPAALTRSERWFGRWGYPLIAANRFLPGTRSAISLAAGVLETAPLRTFACALLSSLLWNSLIVHLGILLGNNVSLIDRWLTTYHRAIILLTAAVALALLVRLAVKKKREPSAGG